MSRELLQMALDALEAEQAHVYDADSNSARRCRPVIAALRSALAAPQAEPCYCDHMGIGVPGVSCGDCPNRDYAPPAAPAPAVCDGGTCGLGGYCANCPKQSAAPARPDEFTCPYCFDQGAAPAVPDIVNPITDEKIIEAAANWDCGTRHENEEWGSYASDYFIKKWNLAGDVAKARAALGDKTSNVEFSGRTRSAGTQG